MAESDISGRVESIQTPDSEKYALVKIQPNLDEMTYTCDGKRPFKITEKDNEVWIYVPLKTKVLTVNHPAFKANIKFKDFNIKALEDKKTYIVEMQYPISVQRKQFGETFSYKVYDKECLPGFLIIENGISIKDDDLFLAYSDHQYRIYEGFGDYEIEHRTKYRMGYFIKMNVHLEPGFVTVVYIETPMTNPTWRSYTVSIDDYYSRYLKVYLP